MLRNTLVFCALATITIVVLIAASSVPARSQAKAPRQFRLAIHGGAGTIDRTQMTPEKEAAYRADLERALRTGHAILAKGGSSLDAVEATLRVLEEVYHLDVVTAWEVFLAEPLEVGEGAHGLRGLTGDVEPQFPHLGTVTGQGPGL